MSLIIGIPLLICLTIHMMTTFPHKTVSASDFYSYRIMVRKELDNHSPRYGPLFNQYLVDMYAKIET